MKTSVTCLFALLTLVLILQPEPAAARTGPDLDPTRWEPGAVRVSPAYCLAAHDIGRFAVGVNNNGTIGTQYSLSGPQDCFTGNPVPNFEYPKGSSTRYLFGAAFWIGAVVGRDTLVSVGQDGWQPNVADFHPDEAPFGNMIYRSSIDPSKPEYEGAISEQDYVAVYTDTFTSGVGGLANDFIDQRPHIPLNIEVTQRSFAWSYSYAEDFVLFDYAIKNIGEERLKRVFLGVYVDADVHTEADPTGAQDDICGFLHSIPAAYLPVQCPDSDIVNLAWIADNDGDLTAPPGQEVPHVTGVRVVRAPKKNLEVSFNWWIGNTDPSVDFGPQTWAKQRDLGTGGQGTPEGDRNKYWFLSNGEFDYDQVFTASISPLDPVWLPPNPILKEDLADGYDTRYLLSFGPFDIESGQTLPLSLAYVAGEDFHRDPNNEADNLPANPIAYYENVSFNDLGDNATWADWIYDNPGVDTDGDGDSGLFYVCNLGGDSSFAGSETTIDTFGGIIDTTIVDIWDYENDTVIPRQGDGVPDFRGANPPPAPLVRVEPRTGAVMVRWNGLRSERAIDNFSRELDFEGYRVYLARDERRDSYTTLQSFDFENYNRWEWDDSVAVGGTIGAFVLRVSPFTLDELRCLYAPLGCGDELWHPDQHPRSKPLVVDTGSGPPAVYYFEPQDFNRSVLGNYQNALTRIRKRDTTAIKPTVEWIEDASTIPDSLRARVLADDSLFLYYEYQFEIEDLLPTVPYWINVTAFDYGSPQSGLPSLETTPTIQPKVTYALESTESIMSRDKLEVYIYPNPYRLDAGYSAAGFEGLGENERDRPVDRTRRIHFANLPPKCTIRIYSLDGDLVR
ncbi:MAG TPA: hypothetical protein VMY05_00225, partial [Acidobacteriota bacterium]|nr:hypothetical protein [Acidobacteriota bacterium]